MFNLRQCHSKFSRQSLLYQVFLLFCLAHGHPEHKIIHLTQVRDTRDSYTNTIFTCVYRRLRATRDELIDFLSVHSTRVTRESPSLIHCLQIVFVHQPILCDSFFFFTRGYLPPPCLSPAYTKQVNHHCPSLPLLLTAVFSLVHSYAAANQKTPPMRRSEVCERSRKKEDIAKIATC